MKLVKDGIVKTYEASAHRRVCRVSHDTEVGAVTLTAYLNKGETVSHSKKFKSMKGATAYATKWMSAT